jgi:hypothetical protein
LLNGDITNLEEVQNVCFGCCVNREDTVAKINDVGLPMLWLGFAVWRRKSFDESHLILPPAQDFLVPGWVSDMLPFRLCSPHPCWHAPQSRFYGLAFGLQSDCPSLAVPLKDNDRQCECKHHSPSHYLFLALPAYTTSYHHYMTTKAYALELGITILDKHNHLQHTYSI